MTKQELRNKYRLLRGRLSQNEVKTLSTKITTQLLELPVWDKSYYHVFMPIKEQNEVDTDLIRNYLFDKNKKIIVSKSNFETVQMTHFIIDKNTHFTKNKYNIFEPENGLQVDSKKIEVVFVPLLAFDLQGHRVGFGKGFYDIFLSQCNPNVVKIGLSFFEAETQIEGVYKNDVQLDYCVTPNALYRF